VGTHDGQAQFAHTCLFFFSFAWMVLRWWNTKEREKITTQTPTLPFTPNPSPKKPKNLKPNTLFFFFSTNS
jgi:hypothetical protein